MYDTYILDEVINIPAIICRVLYMYMLPTYIELTSKRVETRDSRATYTYLVPTYLHMDMFKF